MKQVIIVCVILCLCSCNKHKWEPLFNGTDLNGWTVKITGHQLGDNFGNTFRVEDGLLKVRYDEYDKFNQQFGHIFTNKSYSHYKLRVDYRFVGEQIKDGPGWALRNSGVMLHCPNPEMMAINQNFPISIEAQLLGGDGIHQRPTGSVCTPGTEVSIEGERYKAHCAVSNSKTFHGNQWVHAEIVVRGDSIVHHIINGDTVMTYTKLIYGGGGVIPRPHVKYGTSLKEGYISLQSESHPVDFKNIEIMVLEE